MIKNKLKSKITPKREKQTRYLSQAIQLEEAVNPHIIRATMTMVSLALLAFIGWAGFTNINEVARTPGEVVPHGYQQTVQHLEGGIIEMINVTEGEVVEKGQILVTLTDSIIKEDLQRLQIKQLSLEMQAERLRAFITNRTPDFSNFSQASKSMIADQQDFFDGMLSARQKEQKITREQTKEKRQAILTLKADRETTRGNLKIAKQVYERRSNLNSKGYASDMQVLNDKRDVNTLEGELKRINNQIVVAQKEISQYNDRIESLTAKHRDEALQKLSLVADEIAQNKELIEKLQERIGRLQLRAPTNGLIKGLTVNTIGAVLSPGQTIMEIVPLDEELEISVKISPQDIGHLQIGQPVQVKFSSYDFSRYGSVKGKLEQISATTFTSEDGSRYYQGRVLLDQNHVGNNPDNIIIPGMTVMADIITGRKTILEYMLKPIHISFKTAFTER